jgi:hypothetical protein
MNIADAAAFTVRVCYVRVAEGFWLIVTIKE